MDLNMLRIMTFKISIMSTGNLYSCVILSRYQDCLGGVSQYEQGKIIINNNFTISASNLC